jgi:exopolysaccharide production protein ExoQ
MEINRFKNDVSDRLFSWILLIPVFWLIIPNTKGVAFWKKSIAEEIVDRKQNLLDGSPFDRAILFILLGVALAILLQRKESLFEAFKKNWIPILFIAYMAISILWGEFQFVALKRLVKTLGTLVMVILIYTELKPFESGMKVLQITSYSVIISSWIMVLFFPSIGRMYLPVDGECWAGIALHKNQLGMWMLIGIIVGIWQFNKAKTRTEKLLSILVILSAIGLLWGSKSRTSQLIGIWILLIPMLSRVSGKIGKFFFPLTVLWGTAFLLGFLLYLQMAPPSESIFDKFMTLIGKDRTLTGRSSIWEVCKEVGDKRFILGYGYSTFWLTSSGDYIRRRCEWEFYNAHNGYMELYLGLGIVGIILLFVFLIGGLRNIFIRKKADYQNFETSIVAFLMVLMSNMFETSYGLTSNPLWFLAIFIGFNFIKIETKNFSDKH